MQKTAIASALLAGFLPAQEEGATYHVPGTTTQVRVVQEPGKATSSVSRDGGRTFTNHNELDTELHLRYATFDPLSPPFIPSGLRAKTGCRLFVVQFHTHIIREYRAVLAGMGIELHHYLPSQSYLVRMDRGLLPKVKGLSFVRNVIEYHTAFRLEPEIIAGLGQKSREKARYTIVLVDKRRDARGLEARVVAMGARREVSADGGILFEATMDEAKLLAVADDDRTLYIERSSPPGFDVDLARIQGGTNYVDTLAGIRGIGMVGHIMEGVHATHTELAAISRVRSIPFSPFNTKTSSHGTSTAGLIYARGASLLYRGLMPNAQLIFTHPDYVFNKSTRYAATKSMIQQQLIMLDQASWGYANTLFYTARSAEMDDIIFDLDIFITQSQGDAGSTSQPRNSRPQAWAKNICSVGGFVHRNNTKGADDYWGRTGSTGPAADGRIGVTLAGYYDSVRTISGATGYMTSFGGTSAAAPIVNGLGGNIIEMFTEGLFGYTRTKAPKAPERFKVLPHFSTTKALLIGTANQVPYNASGVSIGANRHQQGFGFPNMRRAYDQRDRLLVIDEIDVLRQGESRTYYLYASGGRFNAVLHYADPPAAANATVHRVNSVDLSVKIANGLGYRGNFGLNVGPFNSPGGFADDRDTEEAVLLTGVPFGLTEVTVSATGVRKDGHVETAATDIDYALVVDGVGGLRDRTGMKLELESTGPGNLSATLTGLTAIAWTEGFTLFSFATSRPVSTGNVLGLEFDSLAFSVLRTPKAAGNPFHFVPGAATQYPNAAFVFPPPVALAVQGRTIDAVVFLMRGSSIADVSNVARVTVR